MSRTSVVRFNWTDDDGSGTTGTPIDDGELQNILDAVDGAISQVTQAKTASYTALPTDDWIRFTTAGVTLNLPSAITESGKLYVVSNEASSGVVTIDPSGAQTIDGSTTIAINPGEFLIIKSDGANWKVITSKLNGNVCEGRLTLTTAVPVTTSDVTAATTVYFTPYVGNRITLYDGSRWQTVTFSEKSIAVPASTNQMYDVWGVLQSGELTLAVDAWTNDTTRATNLTRQDGVLVKTGATTRRYLGSFRTTGVSGQTEDSATKRYLWNMYNRVARPLRRIESTGSWAYNVASWRQANNSTSNQVDVVVGVADALLELNVHGFCNQTAGAWVGQAIGEDTTGTYLADQNGGISFISGYALIWGVLRKYPAVGRHYYAWIEMGGASGISTFYGSSGGIAGDRLGGLNGSIYG
jgi:hypothetical protein